MIVEVPGAPAFIVTPVGLVTRTKSCIVTMTAAECVSEPLVPVVVTV